MRCKEVRRQLGTYNYAAYDPQELPQALREHLATCPSCRRWVSRTRQVSDMLRGLPTDEVPQDFTRSVMARLDQETGSVWERWLHWLIGPLRAPAPRVPAYQLVAASCLLLALLVGGALYTAHLQPADMDHGVGVVVADGGGPGLAGTPVSVSGPRLRRINGQPDTLKIDDLILRHQNYELGKPFGPDPAVRLVSETSY